MMKFVNYFSENRQNDQNGEMVQEITLREAVITCSRVVNFIYLLKKNYSWEILNCHLRMYLCVSIIFACT